MTIFLFKIIILIQKRIKIFLVSLIKINLKTLSKYKTNKFRKFLNNSLINYKYKINNNQKKLYNIKEA